MAPRCLPGPQERGGALFPEDWWGAASPVPTIPSGPAAALPPWSPHVSVCRGQALGPLLETREGGGDDQGRKPAPVGGLSGGGSPSATGRPATTWPLVLRRPLPTPHVKCVDVTVPITLHLRGQLGHIWPLSHGLLAPGLGPWFSNLCLRHCSPAGVSEHRLSGPTPGFLSQAVCQVCLSKFQVRL